MVMSHNLTTSSSPVDLNDLSDWELINPEAAYPTVWVVIVVRKFFLMNT